MFSKYVLYISYFLIIAQIIQAYRIGWLTVGQMQAQEIPCGLPLIAHLGMWGDTPLTLLLANIVARYGSYWTPGDTLRAFLIAGIISAFLHYTYTLSSFPEAHVRDHRLTATGWFHAVYMTGALTILTLFYFPSHVYYEGMGDRFLMTFNSLFLCFHVFCATHIPLSLFDLSWFPEKPLSNCLKSTQISRKYTYLISWLSQGIENLDSYLRIL